jgi:hypothetical protein
MRAFFFVPSDGLGPAEVEARDGRLVLLDASGAVVSQGDFMIATRRLTDFDAQGRFGMDGWLEAPEVEGEYTIRAMVEEGGEVVARCDAPLIVTTTPRLSQLAARPMMPMQQWRLGAVQTAEGATSPSALELRVRGGYCVPGSPCELMIWVGSPPANITLEGRGLELEEAAAGTAASGIVRRTATVTGPEAAVTIIAATDGAEVARREVQLPIVQSGVPLRDGASICAAPCEREYVGLEDPVLVDLFRDGVWTGVTTLDPVSSDADGGSQTIALEEPGLWRIQARTDPFGVEAAASHLIYVGDPSDAVTTMKERLVAEGSDDAFTRAMPIDGVPPEDQVAFAAALLEMDIVPLPRARSGRAQEDIGLGEDRASLRWVSALFVLAIGLLVAGWVMRRGLVASAEARALMAEAGDVEATSKKNVLSMTLTVAGIVFATLLAFAAAAILVLTRGV